MRSKTHALRQRPLDQSVESAQLKQINGPTDDKLRSKCHPLPAHLGAAALLLTVVVPAVSA